MQARIVTTMLILPAYAGVIPTDVNGDFTKSYSPRVCGGDPSILVSLKSIVDSPRVCGGDPCK